MGKKLIRLYLNEELVEDKEYALNKDQSHYLNNVMRKKVGDKIILFNKTEWESVIIIQGKINIVRLEKKLRDQTISPKINLIFAPIKLHRMNFLIEKATELNVTEFTPVITDHSVVDKINIERLRRIAIEASEQCERNTIPVFNDIITLTKLLGDFQGELIFCNETEKSNQIINTGSADKNLLIGPEGGFSTKEIALLNELPFVRSVKISENILRAETAAIAAVLLSI